MMAPHRRRRVLIIQGPQQRNCHGRPLHSSIKVVVEMQMEGAELLFPEGAEVLLEVPLEEELPPEEPWLEVRRHSLV